jgi:hypothetical protein
MILPHPETNATPFWEKHGSSKTMAQKTVTGAFGAICADTFFWGMVFSHFPFKGHFKANNKVN